MKTKAKKSDGTDGEQEATFIQQLMAKYDNDVESVNNVVNDLLLGAIDNVRNILEF